MVKRMQNKIKINYFELFTKGKVGCFLLLLHNISKNLDNKFNKCISFECLKCHSKYVVSDSNPCLAFYIVDGGLPNSILFHNNKHALIRSI